jgi:hypothetical protein
MKGKAYNRGDIIKTDGETILGDNKLGMTIIFMIKETYQEHTTSFLGRTNFKWWFMGSQNFNG